MTILVIDNFDSFTYNLVHQLYELEVEDIQVIRNNAISLEEIKLLSPQLIVLSPGPGCPSEAGITKEIIRELMGKIPLLGVCLGMQAMAECLGMQVIQGNPMHGKNSVVRLLAEANKHPLTKDLPQEFDVIRYHSLHVDDSNCPENTYFKALARTTDDDVLMIMEAMPAPIFAWGVQFHPESIGTPLGKVLMRNVVQAVEKLHVCGQAQTR